MERVLHYRDRIMKRPKPSEIRARILEQHQVLRLRLDALSKALDDSGRELRDLKADVAQLQTLLLEHVKDEERMLIPELREVDGFGAARVEKLKSEHAEQSADLKGILDAIMGSDNRSELTRSILELIERIRQDMEEEESTHLSPNVLKDDLITSDFGG